MRKEIIINATASEIRVAITEDKRLAELFLELPDRERHVGSIFLGRVERVVQGMNAAFVDIGLEQHAFLHFSDAANAGEDYSDLLLDDDDEVEVNGKSAQAPQQNRNDQSRKGKGKPSKKAKEHSGDQNREQSTERDEEKTSTEQKEDSGRGGRNDRPEKKKGKNNRNDRNRPQKEDRPNVSEQGEAEGESSASNDQAKEQDRNRDRRQEKGRHERGRDRNDQKREGDSDRRTQKGDQTGGDANQTESRSDQDQTSSEKQSGSATGEQGEREGRQGRRRPNRRRPNRRGRPEGEERDERTGETGGEPRSEQSASGKPVDAPVNDRETRESSTETGDQPPPRSGNRRKKKGRRPEQKGDERPRSAEQSREEGSAPSSDSRPSSDQPSAESRSGASGDPSIEKSESTGEQPRSRRNNRRRPNRGNRDREERGEGRQENGGTSERREEREPRGDDQQRTGTREDRPERPKGPEQKQPADSSHSADRPDQAAPPAPKKSSRRRPSKKGTAKGSDAGNASASSSTDSSDSKGKSESKGSNESTARSDNSSKKSESTSGEGPTTKKSAKTGRSSRKTTTSSKSTKRGESSKGSSDSGAPAPPEGPKWMDAKLPTFQTKRHGEISIALERSQDVLVQVTRESYASKGVKVSTKISLPGRFIVLMPLDPTIGISRKVQDIKERRRLRGIARKILPDGFGCIIRTVAVDKDSEMLEQELRMLLDRWREIEGELKDAKPPTLLYQDQSVANTVMRDLFTPDVSRVVIDKKGLYEEIRDYISWAAPALANKVEHYSGKGPIFEHYGVESELDKMLASKVYLPNGGYIILEQTEAMMVIDVNSGRYAKEKEQELNALRINLDSAREIARQIRLRDIGGLVVVDFIDLYEEKNRKKVYDELKKEMSRDRAKSVVLPMTQFGIIQMTRQRVRQQLVQTMSEPCPTCNGKGIVQSKGTILRRIERWLTNFRADSREFRLTLTANPHVIDFLTEGEAAMSRLTKLMLKHFVRIKVVPDESLDMEEFRFFSIRRQEDITGDFLDKN